MLRVQGRHRPAGTVLLLRQPRLEDAVEEGHGHEEEADRQGLLRLQFPQAQEVGTQSVHQMQEGEEGREGPDRIRQLLGLRVRIVVRYSAVLSVTRNGIDRAGATVERPFSFA